MGTLVLDSVQKTQRVKVWGSLRAPRSDQKYGHLHSLKSEVESASGCPYPTMAVEDSRE